MSEIWRKTEVQPRTCEIAVGPEIRSICKIIISLRAIVSEIIVGDAFGVDRIDTLFATRITLAFLMVELTNTDSLIVFGSCENLTNLMNLP
jgi:hypothetical protein